MGDLPCWALKRGLEGDEVSEVPLPRSMHALDSDAGFRDSIVAGVGGAFLASSEGSFSLAAFEFMP